MRVILTSKNAFATSESADVMDINTANFSSCSFERLLAAMPIFFCFVGMF